MSAHHYRMKEKVIARLERINIKYKKPVSLQYVNSKNKLDVDCSDCGAAAKVLPQALLKNGYARCFSCQCLAKSRGIKRHRAPVWFVSRFHGMKQRCESVKAKNYPRYGGKGVQVKFDSVDDMWDYLSKLENCDKSLTVDRIDPKGNYEKGNLRWAGKKTQNTNCHYNHNGEIQGVRHSNNSPSFQVRITSDYKELYIGSFVDYFEACCARKSAELRERNYDATK